ncbi:hypothetical protein MPER_12554, partial [Moniliophthora perniciosa FA553]
SLLDLKHSHTNRIYLPWKSRSRRQSDAKWSTNVRRQASLINSRLIHQTKRLTDRFRRTSQDVLLRDVEVNSSETQISESRRRRSTGAIQFGINDNVNPMLGYDKVSGTSKSSPNLTEPVNIEILDSKGLRAVLELPDGFDMLCSLDAAWIPGIIELLQSETQAQTAMIDNDYRNLCMKCLRVLVLKYRRLPQSLFLNNITRHGTHPLRGGGFADIWKGDAQDERKRDKAVALKHPNVLPFLGVNIELFAPGFCLVSPWMANGDIILEIASGLAYIHSLTPMIIHGDIKGANIPVDDHLICRLADFGLAATLGETQIINTSSSAPKGSLRWMAPEMYLNIGTQTNSNSAGTDKSPRDVYAFACTVFEVMTGQVPFAGMIDPAVIFQILNKARPERPTDGWCPDHIWNLVELCWGDDPQQRPCAGPIEEYLRQLMECRETGDAVAFFSVPPRCSAEAVARETTAASSDSASPDFILLHLHD